MEHTDGPTLALSDLAYVLAAMAELDGELETVTGVSIIIRRNRDRSISYDLSYATTHVTAGGEGFLVDTSQMVPAAGADYLCYALADGMGQHGRNVRSRFDRVKELDKELGGEPTA